MAFKSYVKTIANDGSTRYSTKRQFRKEARQILKSETPSGAETINKLKRRLSEIMAYLNTMEKEMSDRSKPQETGTQFKGRHWDVKEMIKEKEKCVKKLEKHGVGINEDALKRGKIVYEGGHDNMLTTENIKSMKLDIFEENAHGLISDDLRDYMLISLESVQNEIQKEQVITEAVAEKIQLQREKFLEFVTESYNAGLISSTQYEVFAEMAEDDFLFNVGTPDQLPNLVGSFLEAAKDGDDIRKAEFRSLIDDANEIKALEAAQDEEVVTEGADCSIVEKLESLKVKLSDDERAMAEKFDKMIADKMDDENEESGKDGEEAAEGDKPAKEEPVKEGADDSGEAEVPEGDDVPDEGGEGTDSGEEATEGDTPAKEEPVKESASSIITNTFGKVVIESSLDTDDANELMNYMVEAVADNVYSEDDLARVQRLLNM